MKRFFFLIFFLILLANAAWAKPVRFIQKMTPSNYQLYQNGAIGDGQVEWRLSLKTPPDIVRYHGAWVKWLNYRKAQFEKKAPLERPNTYYFSNDSGSDGDACTETDPCQTIAKCQDLITTNVGNTRCRFNKGEEWNETTGLTLSTNNNTIDSYGTGNKPLFDDFTLSYGAAGWTNDTGTRYARTEANDIAWLRLTNDKEGEDYGNNLIRVASAAAVTSTTGSWFWTASTLYVNFGGAAPDDVDFALEAVISNTNSGITTSGDGNRVEGIRADGWGAHRTTTAPQQHPFLNAGCTTKTNYWKDIEAFYSGSHLIAHNCGDNSGGHLMVNGAVAGFAKYNGASGDNLFNAYSRDGLQESWFIDIEGRYGTLKSSDWSYATLFQRGQGVFAHTQSASYDIGLMVVNDFVLTNSHTPLLSFGSAGRYTDPSPVTDFTQYRSFFVNVDQPATGNALTGPSLEWQENQILYGLKFKQKLNTAGIGALTNYIPLNTRVINSDIELDAAPVGSTFFALYNTVSTANSLHLLHSSIRFINVNVSGGNSFGIDYDNIFGTTTVAGTGTSKDSSLTNSIVSYINAGNTIYGRQSLTNSATKLLNNAYFDVDPNTGFDAGHDLGVGKVVLSSAYNLTSQAGLLSAGNKDILISHDINGKRRDGNPDIGPVEF